MTGAAGEAIQLGDGYGIDFASPHGDQQLGQGGASVLAAADAVVGELQNIGSAPLSVGTKSVELNLGPLVRG